MKIWMRMVLWSVPMGALGIGAPPAIFAQNETEAATEEDAATEEALQEEEPTVDGLIAEYTEKYGEFMKKVRAASAEERRAIMDERPNPTEYANRLMELVESDLAGDEAKTALVWIASQADPSMQANAVQLIVKHHPEAPEIASLLQRLARAMPSAELLATLDSVNTESQSERTRAIAAWARLMSIKQGYSIWERYADIESRLGGMSDEEVTAEYRMDRKAMTESIEAFRSQFPQDIQDMYSEGFSDRILATMEEFVATYGDVTLSDDEGSPTLGSRMESEIFELKYLAIGREAPDIEGEDLDGESFKLSDYRGKVVVIDFWGDW